jgi:hypothetical protein
MCIPSPSGYIRDGKDLVLRNGFVQETAAADAHDEFVLIVEACREKELAFCRIVYNWGSFVCIGMDADRRDSCGDYGSSMHNTIIPPGAQNSNNFAYLKGRINAITDYDLSREKESIHTVSSRQSRARAGSNYPRWRPGPLWLSWSSMMIDMLLKVLINAIHTQGSVNKLFVIVYLSRLISSSK